MAEVANRDLQENRIDLAREGQEFVPDPDGIIRIQTPHGIVTIVNGRTADGEENAIVFGVDSPLELVAANNDTEKSEGFLSNLPKGPFGRIAAGITMAVGAVVGVGGALSACAPSSDNPNQPSGVGVYGTHQGALTLNQILSVGNGQDIPWGMQWDNYGYQYPSNRVVMNGENYLFVARVDDVVYVKCQDVADCFSPNAEVKTLQGLDAAGMAGQYNGPGGFQDQNGNYKFLVDPDTGPTQMCDIATNGNGTLEVSNCAEIEPIMFTGPSVFLKNGVPHGLFNSIATVEDRDLHSGVTVDTAASADWANACSVGVETEDGTAVIGSQKQKIQGVTHCRLVTASSWAELVANPIALQSLNVGSNKVKSARLFGNYIVYRYSEKLRFVEIPPAPQNPESDADAGSPDADADQPDTIDGPDADVAEPDADAAEPDAEIAQDTADAAEAVIEPDVGPDTPPDQDTGPELPPDNDPEQDSSPDTSDAQNPDTTPGPCDFANPKLTIPQGCQLENCVDPSVDIKGKCTFSVDLGKAKPANIELDGTYQIDFLKKIGAHLAGKYKIIDNGNLFNTVAGNLGTGVEGTIYSGEFMAGSNYQLSCQEGSIKVFLIKGNGEKELLATLDGGETQIFDLYNPKPQPEQNPEAQPEPEPQPEEAPDASQPEAANDIDSPKPEQASDTGPSQPELPQPDTKDTTPPPSKPPSNDGGCNITGGTGHHLATIALALMALGATIRRRPFTPPDKSF